MTNSRQFKAWLMEEGLDHHDAGNGRCDGCLTADVARTQWGPSATCDLCLAYSYGHDEGARTVAREVLSGLVSGLMENQSSDVGDPAVFMRFIQEAIRANGASSLRLAG